VLTSLRLVGMRFRDERRRLSGTVESEKITHHRALAPAVPGSIEIGNLSERGSCDNRCASSASYGRLFLGAYVPVTEYDLGGGDQLRGGELPV
jgi:hypothetical protein